MQPIGHRERPVRSLIRDGTKMGQNGRRLLATVPSLDGRDQALSPRRPESLLSLLRARLPFGLVLAGFGVTAAWAAFLAWCLFALLRWAVG